MAKKSRHKSNSKAKKGQIEIDNSYPTMVKSNDIADISKISKIKDKFKSAKEKTYGLEDFIKEFVSNLLSPRTKRNYLKDLQMFFEFLYLGGENVKKPADIQSYHFSIYRDFLIEEGYAPATINRRLVVIRSFMKWALAHKLIQSNPLDSVKLPKSATKNPTQAFSDEEVRMMIDAPDIKTREGICHRLVLILLFHLGLRRSELAQLKFKDIKEERNHHILVIDGKGGKVRVLPLAKELLTEIFRFKARFESHTELELADDDFLIQTIKGGVNKSPCHGSTIYRIVSRYAKKLGINKTVGAHSCRATVISHLLDTKKVMIRDVADFAGHSQISTTQRYDKKRKGLDDSAAYSVDYDFDIKKDKAS